MARKTNLSAEEVNDLDEINRREQRKTGFALMGTRDSGAARLSNGIVVKWHSASLPWTEQAPGVQVRDGNVPDGKFLINNILYDAEELRKYLRWA